MSVLLQDQGLLWRRAGTALLFLCLVIGVGSRGTVAPVPPRSASALSGQVTSRFAIADFDGDSRPDLATVQVGQISASAARYWIRFQMSTGSRQAIGVTAPIGGLEIALRDVNGDNCLDLIVTTARLNQPVAVLLNDGHGNFTLNDPAAFPGIVWGSATYWTPAGVQWKDVAVVLPSRNLPGDCDESKGVSSPRYLPGARVSAASHLPAFPLAVSVLGRAPPAFVLHV
jgi:hypothetical protein